MCTVSPTQLFIHPSIPDNQLPMHELFIQLEQKFPCPYMVRNESLNCSMSLTSRKRCALTTHLVGFNVLDVGDFILKKSFSSLLSIRFGINHAFSSKSFLQNYYENYDSLCLLFSCPPSFFVLLSI